MRYILLLLCIIPLTATSQSQYKYCLSGGFYSECITLEDSNRFTYESAGDVGNAVAVSHGRYTLSRTKLVLRFGDASEYKSHVQLKISPGVNDDLFRMEITVRDQLNKEPLIAVLIRLCDDHGNVLAQGLTDVDGHLAINSPRTAQIGAVQLTSVGYDPLTVPVSASGDYTLTALMAQAYMGMPAGKVLTYKIKGGKNDFELRPRGQERFEKREIRKF